LLIHRKNIIHAVIGLAVGIISASSAPSWMDIKEGMHRINGVVQSTGYAEGTYRMIMKDGVLDGKRVRGYVQLNFYKDAPEVAVGSIVSVSFKAKPYRGLGNKGEFDYKLFLLAKGIVLTGVVNEAGTVQILKRKKQHGLRYELNSALSLLARPEAEVIKAMITGDTSGISDSIQDRFNSLGISHLIAISGLNMAIIIFIGYTIAFSILRFLPFITIRIDTPLVAKVCGLIGVVIYTFFVGPIIPTLRAAIMAVSCIAGYLFLRKSHVLESLAIAGIIILSLWPYSLYSASFLLTFAAVLGIIGILRKKEGGQGLIQLFTIPVVVAAFTMPVTNYLFGLVSWVSILVNIIFVPLFSMVIMPLSIAGLIIFPLSQTISLQLFSPAMDAIRFIFLLSDFIGSLHVVPQPSIYWVYTCYVGLIVAFFGSRSAWRLILLLVACTLIIIIPVFQCYMNNRVPLRFDFISVGQGDSILLTEGPHSVLIDAGPSYAGFDAGRHVVAPLLIKRGVTSLDLVVITHSHPDHIGGIPYILERFQIGEVWSNVARDRNPEFQEVLRITKKRSIPFRNICSGDHLHLGNMDIEVLNPQIRFDNKDERMDQNVHSIVLRVGDKNMKGIFMGDAEMFGELMITHLQKDISAQVLKVAHHGARKSCLDLFLDKVQPKIAVISCGYNNRYGDPSQETLSRLKKRNITVYRTDISGEIIITSFPGSYNVKSSRSLTDNQ
jgi:competence protein ComEC